MKPHSNYSKILLDLGVIPTIPTTTWAKPQMTQSILAMKLRCSIFFPCWLLLIPAPSCHVKK